MTWRAMARAYCFPLIALCGVIFYISQIFGSHSLIELGNSPSEFSVSTQSDDVIHSDDEEIDQAYDAFMMETYGWTKALLSKIQQNINPFHLDAYYQAIGTLKSVPHYLPGKHAHPQTPYLTNYWYGRLDTNFENIHPIKQGWKIHVSAQLWSAQKIASLVLPFLHYNTGTKGKLISYKIIPSIPLMRSLWDFSNLEGQETQVGKFIVIYADDADHAYFLAKEIDQLLLDAKASGLLQDSDFYPLIGDAMVGHSKGVFIRYGCYTTKPFIKVLPNRDVDLEEITEGIEIEEDDRFYPWPDFMNQNNEAWKREPSPFRDLPLLWKNYYNQQQISSWEERPVFWEKHGVDSLKEQTSKTSYSFHTDDDRKAVDDYSTVTKALDEEPVLLRPTPVRTLKPYVLKQSEDENTLGIVMPKPIEGRQAPKIFGSDVSEIKDGDKDR